MDDGELGDVICKVVVGNDELGNEVCNVVLSFSDCKDLYSEIRLASVEAAPICEESKANAED